MSRIMIHSNAPWVPTGYGRQTKLLMPHLAGDGHEVAVSAFHGLSGGIIDWEGYPVYPAGAEPYGVDVVAAHASHFKADVVLFLMDYWQMTRAAAEVRTLRAAAWLPTDCDPLGKPDRAALSSTGAVPIAMSRFGERTLTEAGYKPLYVPHAVDLEVYNDSMDREAMRDALGFSGRFVAGICAANSDGLRKGWPEQLTAFARFHAKHPDSVLLIHTLAGNPHGLPLAKMVESFGLESAVLWSDQYAQLSGLIDDETMSGWFSCLDVLLACSYAEAFGIPLIEAQACGTPVITTKGSAMAELAGPGWTVAGEPFWNPVHDANWVRPSIDGIVRALERAYSTPAAGAHKRRMAAVRFASTYGRFDVFENYWQPAIQIIEGTEPTPLIAESGGLRWRMGDLRNRCGDVLALNHESELEPHIRALFPAGSGESAVFVDIGAHVGHWALRLADQCRRVIAVEADPQTAARLVENIQLNELGNIRVIAAAAWDAHAELSMFAPNGYDHDGSNQVRDREGGQRVQAFPLDDVDLLGSEPRIDVVKLDVEGADLHVLRGMRATLDRTRPVLFIEDHSIYGFYDRADLDGLLVELGYVVEDLPLYQGYLIARPVAA